MLTDWSKFLGDPLFQVNLSLWLTQPRPSAGLSPRPLLREAGYEVYQIEPSLALPLSVQTALGASKLPFSQSSEPDILFRGPQGAILLWECKRSLFGYAPPNNEREHKQARTFLLATSALLESALGLPPGRVRATHLNYCAMRKEGTPQFAGVQAIAGELQAAKFAITSSSAFLLFVENQALCLVVEPGLATLPAPLQTAVGSSPCELLKVGDEKTDPRPLYYYPWMPDSEPQPDDYNMAQFGNRVLGAIAQFLGSRKAPYSAEISFEEVLRLVYNPFFPNWRSVGQRQHIKAKAFELASKQIRSVNTKKDEEQVEVKQETVGGSLGKLVVSVPTVKLHRRVIEALRKWESTPWFTPQQEEFDWGAQQPATPPPPAPPAP